MITAMLPLVLLLGPLMFGSHSSANNFSSIACHERSKPVASEHATDLNGVAWPPLCLESREGPSAEHFFVIGDWGGQVRPWIPPLPADNTRGRGRRFVPEIDGNAQHLVANQMKVRSQANKPRYVLNAGDSFYWGGLDAECGLPMNTTVRLDQWEHVFERVYSGPGLDGVPWMGVLGNHDFGGWMFTAAWEQLIAYSWYEAPPVHQGRWLMPAMYWSRRIHHPGFTVDIFFHDSNVNDAFPPEMFPNHNLCSEEHNVPNASCGPHGPASLTGCAAWFQSLWDAQVPWLSAGLAASDADWQFVVSHFPPDFRIDFWAQLSARYGIDLIVGGHRHQEEVHYKDGFGGGILDNTAWVVAGGGGGITSEGLPRVDGQDDMYGFMDVTITKSQFLIEAISHSGIVRSSTWVYPRAKQMQQAEHVGVANYMTENATDSPPRTLSAPQGRDEPDIFASEVSEACSFTAMGGGLISTFLSFLAASLWIKDADLLQ